MQATEIAALIQAHLPQAEVQVRGEDGAHFEALIIDTGFQGLNRVARQRQVYAALGERIYNGTIHALSIRAYTPQEWQAHQA